MPSMVWCDRAPYVVVEGVELIDARIQKVEGAFVSFRLVNDEYVLLNKNRISAFYRHPETGR